MAKIKYKYFISPTVFGIDYWDENGQIAINDQITQKQLEYLYTYNNMYQIFRKEI